MSTSNNWLFALNPLSLFFLSGFATQLFISLCCNDPKTGYINRRDVKKSTDERMNKWQICFYDVCRTFFNDHSSEDEKNVFERSPTLNPYTVHSTLLVIYSKAISDFMSNNSNLGPNTANHIDFWYGFILNTLKNSLLWDEFPQANRTALLTFMVEHSNWKQNAKSTDNGDKNYSHCHFSPLLIFIRSMTLVIIHQTHFDMGMFTGWARFNAFVVKNLFQIETYQTAFNNHTRIPKFSKFPYIFFLDVQQLFTEWDRDAQSLKCVPVKKIFVLIKDQIVTKMNTFSHTQLKNMDCCDEEEKQSKVFVDIIKFAEEKMKKILNCEKQSKCQANKRLKMISVTEDSTDDLFSGVECWTCHFLFPANDVPEEEPCFAY
jgi:hypothetical protein